MMDKNNPISLRQKIQATKKAGYAGNGDGKVHVSDADAYPNLLELLVVTGSPGMPVKGGRVALFVQDGHLTACLSCPAEKAIAFKALAGFQDALTQLEGYLASGDLEWRQERPQGAR